MEPRAFLFQPSYAFIARGSKRVVLGNETHVYNQSSFLLTTVGLPTVVQVLGATEAAPCLSMQQDLDIEMARDLIAEVDQLGPRAVAHGRALAIGPVTPALASATLRLMELLDSPDDIRILARSIQREIVYRVLMSPVGGHLRQVVQLGTPTHSVSVALRWIRENFARSLRIKDLARVAGMGESTLHHHFRTLTAMSPLQYQKQLRLHEARRLMLTERMDAGVAARRVGYESTTQFNREYRRLFGVPPKRDVRAILSSAARGSPTRAVLG